MTVYLFGKVNAPRSEGTGFRGKTVGYWDAGAGGSIEARDAAVV